MAKDLTDRLAASREHYAAGEVGLRPARELVFSGGVMVDLE